MNKIVIGVVIIVVVIGGFLLFSGDDEVNIDDRNLASELESDSNVNVKEVEPGSIDADVESSLWRETSLKDVRTGNSFKVSDFSGKPILLESFAVWCPKCTSQQKIIKDLHEELGESVVSISLDTDPNEDESQVLSHIQNNGFDWYYAVSPTEITKNLVDEFGTGIVSAPSVPMILICPDGSAEKLKTGSKSVEFLKDKINSC
jgi:thiol-disulfide isomerase/thioredoxin